MVRKTIRKINGEAEKVFKTLIKSKAFSIKVLFLFMLLVINANGNVHNYNKQRALCDEPATLKSEMLIFKVKQQAYDNLIKEVDAFIDNAAPANEISPKILIDVCNTYDIDLVFVLAQGLLESHYGTKGIAASTNSIFNVGTYDDGQILYRFSHPNESIEPYAKLLVKRYLVNKDETGLLANYTNMYGQRFASSTKYEEYMKVLMIKIGMTTKIRLYQEITKMDNESILAFFGPIDIIPGGNNLYAMD